jgi:hypothetical protein
MRAPRAGNNSGERPVDALLRGDLRSSGSRSPSPHPAAGRAARTVFRVPVVEAVHDMPPTARSSEAAAHSSAEVAAVEKSGAGGAAGRDRSPSPTLARPPSPGRSANFGKGAGPAKPSSGSRPTGGPLGPGGGKKKKKKKGKGKGDKGGGKGRPQDGQARGAPAAAKPSGG